MTLEKGVFGCSESYSSVCPLDGTCSENGFCQLTQFDGPQCSCTAGFWGDGKDICSDIDEWLYFKSYKFILTISF